MHRSTGVQVALAAAVAVTPAARTVTRTGQPTPPATGSAGDGLGSGVVYRTDMVITNQHVVTDGRDVTIDYADGNSSAGTVLATDNVADIAVIRPSASPSRPVPPLTHPYLGSPSAGSPRRSVTARESPPQQGALVVGVASGGPAAAAGLHPGDVITALTGHMVGSVENLADALRRTKPGQQVPLIAARGTGHLALTVTIGSVTG